ncbi:CBS domain-containing protein [Streptomyces sp. NPDC048389]|uniref:CBS domain-containing protein n=1 Tax=Streptomyces sp. NPDC048389 TaxID=3154622 RepID=UPI003451ADEF
MTPTVVAVERDARFKEIVTAMKQWQVTAVPVLEGEGRVVGVVSEADLLAKEELRDTEPTLIGRQERLADHAKAGAVTARNLMSAPAITVHPGATLPQATRLMARHQVKRLPVADEQGLLRGIVSRSDLLKVFLRTDEDLAEEVRHDVTARARRTASRSSGSRSPDALVPSWLRGLRRQFPHPRMDLVPPAEGVSEGVLRRCAGTR